MKIAQDDFSSPRLGMLSECQFRVKMHINPRTWTPLFAHFRFSRPPRLTLDGFQGPTSALTGPNVRRGGEGGGRGRDPGIFCQIRVRGLSLLLFRVSTVVLLLLFNNKNSVQALTLRCSNGQLRYEVEVEVEVSPEVTLSLSPSEILKFEVEAEVEVSPECLSVSRPS